MNMTEDSSIDVSDKNIKIKSFNHQTNEVEYKKILFLVRKIDSNILILKLSSNDILLKATGDHLIFDYNKKDYYPLKDYIDNEVSVLTSSGQPIVATVIESFEKSPILDIQVEDNENYFSNGILSHNTGGNALKFYASQRLDMGKGKADDNGDEDATKTSVKIKVIKNKVAPPFRKGEFEIQFGKGFSRDADLLSLACKYEIINKAGSWYSYKDQKIGQGAENAANWLKEDPARYEEIEKLTREAMLKR